MNNKELLNESDQSTFRALNGILGWIAGTSRPQLAYSYAHFSSRINTATKGDAKRLLRTLEKAKSDRSTLRFSNIGDVSDWTYEVYVDASPGKNHVFDTFTGEICFLRGKNNLRNVISWKSQKLDIPSATPLEAEAEALLNATSKIKNFKYLFHEVFNLDIPTDMFTDSKSLSSAVNSDNSASKSRKIAVAIITARKLKEEDGNIRLEWTQGGKNPADTLTKGTADPRLLIELLQSGKTDLMTRDLA